MRRNDDAGTFGALLIVFGLFGAAYTGSVAINLIICVLIIYSGYLLEKTKKYRTILKVGFCLCVLVSIFMLCMLFSNNFVWLSVSFALMGLFMLPMLPAVLENSAEITYPVSEEFSTGLLFMGALHSAHQQPLSIYYYDIVNFIVSA